MNDLLRYLFRKKMEFFPHIEFGKFPPIGWVRDKWRARLQRPYVEVNGLKIFLNLKDSPDWFINNEYEPAITKLMLETARPGDVVLDVGANIGYFTVLLAQKVGPQGKVFAFEPSPDNFALLRKNVETNGFSNVVLINKAVSDRQQTLRLYLSKENMGDHRIYDSGDARESVVVDCVSLDACLASTPAKIRLLKMDVQGAEFQVLQGMQSLLNKNPDIILFMEFWPHGLFRSGADPQALLDFLHEQKFILFDEQSPNIPVDSRILNELCQQMHIVSNHKYLNLICRRNRGSA